MRGRSLTPFLSGASTVLIMVERRCFSILVIISRQIRIRVSTRTLQAASNIHSCMLCTYASTVKRDFSSCRGLSEIFASWPPPHTRQWLKESDTCHAVEIVVLRAELQGSRTIKTGQQEIKYIWAMFPDLLKTEKDDLQDFRGLAQYEEPNLMFVGLNVVLHRC